MNFETIRDVNFDLGDIVHSIQKKPFLKQTEGAMILQPVDK